MRVKDAVGQFGEDLAVTRLEAAGLVVLERNWRCREGEVDVVAAEAGTLVFVEVKTRSSAAFGLPAEAVTREKLARLRRIALRWMLEHREIARNYSEIRIDVVAVLRLAPGGPAVEHLRGVA